MEAQASTAGTDGFTIRCGTYDDDDDVVVVTDEEAKLIFAKCDYFRHVFAYGTKETEERILVKPDWSKETTKQLVQLLTTGKANLSDWNSFLLLESACGQILLVDVTLSIPSFAKAGKTIKEHTVPRDKLADIQNCAQDAKGVSIGLEINSQPLTCDSWVELLSKGITVSEDAAPFVQATFVPKPKQRKNPSSLDIIFPDALSDMDGMFVFGICGGKTSNYKVTASSKYSNGALLYQLCEIFNKHFENPQEAGVLPRQGFSLRVPCGFGFRLARGLHEKISSTTGAKVYFHKGNSLGYFLDGSNDGCPTIAGTLDQIRDAINMLPDHVISTYTSGQLEGKHHECKRCSLRVSAPTPETLNRLVDGLAKCQENPNTLGMHIATKSFYAVKTVDDMKLLLDSLVGQKGTAVRGESGTMFKLSALNYPKGVF